MDKQRVKFVKNYRGELTAKRQMVAGDVWTWPADVAAKLIEMGVAVEVKNAAPRIVTAMRSMQQARVTQPTPDAIPRPDIPDVDDPGEHSVAVVAAYASQNRGEIERLITAEEAGQNRVTLLRTLRTLGGK